MVPDLTVRKTLKAIVEEAVPAGTRVWHRWMADQDEKQWAGFLTPFEGAHKGKVHGYMIARRSVKTERQANGGRMKHWWTYTIAGFRFWERGTNDGPNSEDDFSTELAAIANKIAQMPVLGLDGEDDNVLMHEELQIGLQHTAPFNGGLAHVAQCYLTVVLYEQT